MPIELNASSAAPHKVTSALKRAGEATGAGFEFLKAMAERESSLDPTAKAKTSSAAGLFQFIDQTWLGAVKQYGGRHGLSDYAGDIARGSDGRFAVADAARRDEILNLRFDADKSAALAGELANENKSFLERRLGRAASGADLYTAHFLGPAGAVKLLNAAANVKAADLLPQASAANKQVFYDGARPKTVGEVVASIASSMEGAGNSVRTQEVSPKFSSRTSVVPEYTPYKNKNVNEMAAERLEFDAERGAAAPNSERSVRVREASLELEIPPRVSSLPSFEETRGRHPYRTITEMDVGRLDAVIMQAARRATAEPAGADRSKSSSQAEQSSGSVYNVTASSSRLSAMAMTALQALDPTKLTATRDEAGKPAFEVDDALLR